MMGAVQFYHMLLWVCLFSHINQFYIDRYFGLVWAEAKKITEKLGAGIKCLPHHVILLWAQEANKERAMTLFRVDAVNSCLDFDKHILLYAYAPAMAESDYALWMICPASCFAPVGSTARSCGSDDRRTASCSSSCLSPMPCGKIAKSEYFAKAVTEVHSSITYGKFLSCKQFVSVRWVLPPELLCFSKKLEAITILWLSSGWWLAFRCLNMERSIWLDIFVCPET